MARAALRRLLGGEPVALRGVPVGPAGRRADLTGFPLSLGAAAGGPARPGEPAAIALLEERTEDLRAGEERERSRRLRALQDLSGRVASELDGAARDDRAAGVLGALRTFAGEGSAGAVPEGLDLSALVEEALRSPASGARGLPSGVTVATSVQTGLWKVPGDRAAIREALAEVIINGAEAMPGGGRIGVRLRNRRVDGGEADTLPAGPYVELEVEDGGEGIPPGDPARPFEPFFTTKSRDRSRGLGLSIAYGAVRRHRGDIRIASAPGKGATVTILLPADPAA